MGFGLLQESGKMRNPTKLQTCCYKIFRDIEVGAKFGQLVKMRPNKTQ
jgi:hypothetical protein